jgi:hypothetical protein
MKPVRINLKKEPDKFKDVKVISWISLTCFLLMLLAMYIRIRMG